MKLMQNYVNTKLAFWLKANKLTPNVSKTIYIVFRDKTNALDFSDLNIDRLGMDRIENSVKFVRRQPREVFVLE